MKRVVSLLLALATAICVSAPAFAATDDYGINRTANGTTANDVITFNEDGSINYGTTANGTDNNVGSRALLSDPLTRVSYGTSGNAITLTANEIVIVEDNNTNAIIMPETHLDPGTEYKFKVYYVNTAGGTNISAVDAQNHITPILDSMMAGGKFRLRAVKGSSVISTAKVEKRGSGNSATYRLTITTKENWSTKETDVEYTLAVTNQGAGGVPFAQGNMTFKVGYGRFTDEEIDSFAEGDIITISNDFPVILKKQFETLAKNYNYKAIQFESEDGIWSYLGRVSGMGDTNFTYSRDVVPAIVTKFEDQEFEFLTFGAGVNFPTNGEMRIDVSDFSDEFNTMYTYLYRDGKLTPISTTYDSGADELVFRTNYLGSFVITNEQITDTTIINQGNQTVPEEPAEEVPNVTNPENPNTGASSSMNTAVALALTSIAAAAMVGRKRK